MERASFAAFDEHGSPGVLYIDHEDLPPVSADEILVRMHAAGVNAYDVKHRAGYVGSVKTGTRIGYDGSGVVVRVGEAVTEWVSGDRVLVRNKLGTNSTHMIVRSRNLLPLPDNVSFEVAAAIGTPFSVAYQSLRSLDVSAGDTLLIHGGSGAVGTAAIQFAQLLGASRIIATTSSRGFDQIEKLGAEPVNYGIGLEERLDDILGGARISVILDAAGTTEALDSHTRLTDRNRWATVAAGREADGKGLRSFGGSSQRRLSVEEINLRSLGITEGLRLLGRDEVSMRVGAAFALDDVAAAHSAYEESSFNGRIVLSPLEVSAPASL